ncbi:hypothetical protein LshimejAT787_0901920 [Lyophyllum shimeji]|uniref:Uncharacterized protein n=1 Tax=Lyophyllum shimeji TaxID=47721 RepID=A0A9P3UQ69_LYOSH|nr:hypothetical protein LshimejAT787_0901920 [Lyophyllum shimeji]
MLFNRQSTGEDSEIGDHIPSTSVKRLLPPHPPRLFSCCSRIKYAPAYQPLMLGHEVYVKEILTSRRLYIPFLRIFSEPSVAYCILLFYNHRYEALRRQLVVSKLPSVDLIHPITLHDIRPAVTCVYFSIHKRQKSLRLLNKEPPCTAQCYS